MTFLEIKSFIFCFKFCFTCSANKIVSFIMFIVVTFSWPHWVPWTLYLPSLSYFKKLECVTFSVLCERFNSCSSLSKFIRNFLISSFILHYIILKFLTFLFWFPSFYLSWPWLDLRVTSKSFTSQLNNFFVPQLGLSPSRHARIIKFNTSLIVFSIFVKLQPWKTRHKSSTPLL